VQTIDKILATANKALEKFIYYNRLEILGRGKSYIKLRLHITRSLFVQVNRNETANLTNMVLLLDFRRIYGRDEYQGAWHRHPESDPNVHNHSSEGCKQIALDDFLEEVDDILRKRGLV